MKETNHIQLSPLIQNKSPLVKRSIPNNYLSDAPLPITDFFHTSKITFDYETKKDKYPYFSGEQSSCSLRTKYRPIMNRLIMKNKSSLSIATLNN